MITQKQIIINYLQQANQWIPSHHLQGTPTKWGFIGSEGKRRARELFSEGKIEHKLEGKFSYYRAKPITYRQYFVLDEKGQRIQTLNLQQL